MSRGTIAALAAALTMGGAQALASTGVGDAPPNTREVILVGNNWGGTADVLRPRGDFRRIARINIVPDKEKRMMEVMTDPERLIYFLAIREFVGEGNDQFVDDMYTSNDGRLLIVSRPSFRDVVALNLKTGKIVWRFVVDGQRSDHMAISPDGRHVAVSASTGNVVHILNTKTGREVDRFPSGDSPHENIYSADGKRLYHASIGLVYTPGDNGSIDTDTSKGERYFQIVRRRDHKITTRLDMGDELERAGYPNMSSAVRPMAIGKREGFVYFQVSFFHGFVEYNLKKEKVRRLARLPISEEARNTPREQYLLDSAHHGISLSGNGKRLCVAGTMSDYAAIVNRKNFKRKVFRRGEKPYWSTTSADGKRCYVSWSGTDRISIFSFRRREEIARIKVGDHPQRIRTGFIRRGALAGQR